MMSGLPSRLSKTMMKTILQNVRVFAVNDHMDRIIDETGKSIKAKTVTLEVRPDQVELITMADSIGRIRLSARRSDDLVDESTRGASPADVFGNQNLGLADEGAPLPDWLSGLGQQPTPEPEPEPTRVASTAQATRMEILEPNGSRYYEFSEDGPPRDITDEVGSSYEEEEDDEDNWEDEDDELEEESDSFEGPVEYDG